MTEDLDISEGISSTLANLRVLPAGRYIFPEIRFATCSGSISEVAFLTAPVHADSRLEVNISVWRPTGSKYEKVSEYIIQQAVQRSEDSEDYEEITVSISEPLPVYAGDILGLSLLPLSVVGETTSIPVLANFDTSTNVGLTEEAESCWSIDDGNLSDCHVLALAAHPVIAVSLTDYEDGKN